MSFSDTLGPLLRDAASLNRSPDAAREGRIIAGLEHPDDEVRGAAIGAATACPNDALVQQLMELAAHEDASVTAREAALIALGPALEEAFMADAHLDALLGLHPVDDAPPMTPETLDRAAARMELLYRDAATPRLIRRRALEAAVRAPAGWEPGAARAAWQSRDAEWRLTAVFCAGYLDGLEQCVLSALEDEDEGLVAEALEAVEASGLERAAGRVRALLEDTQRPLDIRGRACLALGQCGGSDDWDSLDALASSDDPELAEAAVLGLAVLDARMESVGLDEVW